MEEKSKVSDELFEIESMLNHWGSDRVRRPRAFVAEISRLFLSVENSLGRLDVNDDSVEAMAHKFQKMKASFDEIQSAALTEEPRREVVPPTKRAPRSLCDDFLVSSLWTFLICLFFVVVWNEYRRTH
jgi:hypothetical protein